MMQTWLFVFGIFVSIVGMSWYSQNSAKRVEIAGLCTMAAGIIVATMAALL